MIQVDILFIAAAIICIGFMLRSCRVLCLCLVPLSSHKSGRCTAELHHATHFWHSTLYTAALVTSSRQQRTTSPPKESCHGQAGDEGPHAWSLANSSWLRWSMPTWWTTPQSGNLVLSFHDNSGLSGTVSAPAKGIAVPVERHGVLWIRGAWRGGVSSPPLTLPSPTPSLPSPPLPLEVGSLNAARGSGGAYSAHPAGSGAEPQPKLNLVHFSLKIWHLVATNLVIFPRVN